MMECDVYVTKDNVVVCCHDTRLGRIAGTENTIADYNFADLPPIRKVLDYGGYAGSYVQTEEDDGQWLTLETLFTNMPTRVLYSIDLKGMKASSATYVYDLIKRFGLERRVVWGSGDPDVHAKLSELNSDIAKYYPYNSLVNLHLWHMFGCLFCRKLENDFLMSPVMTSE